MSMETIERLLKPAMERTYRITRFTTKEKVEYIKKKYNLTHGQGKRKRKK